MAKNGYYFHNLKRNWIPFTIFEFSFENVSISETLILSFLVISLIFMWERVNAKYEPLTHWLYHNKREYRLYALVNMDDICILSSESSASDQ